MTDYMHVEIRFAYIKMLLNAFYQTSENVDYYENSLQSSNTTNLRGTTTAS